MPKVTVPGLKESKGIQEFALLDPGKYSVEVLKVDEEESKRSPGMNYKFRMKVLEGIGDAAVQKSGSKAAGMGYFENLFLMGEMHPQYEEYGHIGVDQLKSMVIAFKVPLKGDDLDFQAFIGKTCIIDVRQEQDKKSKNDDGTPRVFNRVAKWTADLKK